MSYNSKRIIVNMVAAVILFIGYIVYALGSSAPSSEDIRAWAVAILVFIGISVATSLIIQVLFHVCLAIGISVKEGEEDTDKIDRTISAAMVEDEMYKLISLKAIRVAYICAGISFLATLAALACGAPMVLALHLAFGGVAAGAFIEGIVSIYFHERGIHNG